MVGARYLSQYREILSESSLLKVCEVLSLVCETEDYLTYTSEYVSSDADYELLLELRESFLKDQLQKLDRRKFVRPLVDAIDLLTRKHNRKKK